VPQSVICRLPEIVMAQTAKPAAIEISIKKDRFFAVLSKSPIGTQVVLEPADTSRSARLTVTKAGGARTGKTP
jgi:hypothetical protein